VRQFTRVTRCRLLLVPSFTELEWGVRPSLEEWADVASFDTPGVGAEPVPASVGTNPERQDDRLARWREAAVERGLAEIDRHGWERLVIATDSHGAPTAVGIALRRKGAVAGLALGHASLSHARRGARAPIREGVWEAMAQLAKTGGDAFVRYGIAQMTLGGISEERAAEMLERFPDTALISEMVEALGESPEPIRDDLAELGVPLLLAKHEGCLARTDEGFEDIVAAFPEARTVLCPEACSSSPAFAQALRAFCEEVAAE
jgi:hypothetical protein